MPEDGTRNVCPHHLCKVTRANITYPLPSPRYVLSHPPSISDTEGVRKGYSLPANPRTTAPRSEEETTLIIYLEPIDSTADRLRGDLLRKED